MKLKILIVAITVFASSFLKAQETIVLNNQDGVYVTYELTKLESTSKKDTYLAIIKAENKNSFDVYYTAQQYRPGYGLGTAPSQTNSLNGQAFAQANVRNSTEFLGDYDYVPLKGNMTRAITTNNQVLYVLESGRSVTTEKKFKVKTGVKPILTNSFLVPLRPIDYFDLAISEETVNGDWVSSCGNILMSLMLTRNENGEIIIRQIINGKQNIWRKAGSNTFEKMYDRGITITYNKINGSFSYTSSDGVLCNWIRR